MKRKHHKVRNLVINGRRRHAINKVVDNKNITPKNEKEHAREVRVFELFQSSADFYIW